MKEIIRKVLGKIIGLDSITRQINDLDDKYKEQISTIHYFLNNYCDITKFPHDKDPNLCLLQLCDIQLLRIVDKVLTKLNVTYWLDYGTLLGAVRHKAFIPWDDDMDISVVRSDYNRLKAELPTELKKYDIDVSLSDARLGIGYKHLNTGIWLDIFPDDILLSNQSIEEVKDDILCKQRNWRTKILPIYGNLTEKEVEIQKNRIFGFPVTIQRRYRSTVDYACDNKFCPLKCLTICYFLSEIGMFLFAYIRYFLYLYAYETTGY